MLNKIGPMMLVVVLWFGGPEFVLVVVADDRMSSSNTIKPLVVWMGRKGHILLFFVLHFVIIFCSQTVGGGGEGEV